MNSRQQDAWDAEYKDQQLLSPSHVPQADVMRFVKWLKKEYKRHDSRLDFDGLRVLDLGSGTGRNSVYFAEQGAEVIGYEFAPRAILAARAHARHRELPITYTLQDIGETYPLQHVSVSIALDVTSSNSLSDEGREVYLKETARVLAHGGYLLVRALSLEGDAHAKELVKRFPGPDPDTYVHPDLGITEKVFTRESFLATYDPYFNIISLDRVQHYATVAGRTYKRSYWIAYLQKPPKSIPD